MDGKIIRVFIHLFLALMGVFFLLMVVNYFGNTSAGPEAGIDAEGERPMEGPFSQTAKYARKGKGATPLSARPERSTDSVRNEGAIMIVRESGFAGVADKPKDLMSVLNDMGGGTKKPAPISLNDSDMKKKIGAPAAPERHLAGGTVPELGRQPGLEGVTLITAAVDFKIFKSSEVWGVFANSRGIKAARHDFSSSDLLILVPVSDFPSGIFKIRGVDRNKKETVVKYSVDPMNMAAGADPAVREAYAVAAVPKKGPPVRLQQVP